MSLCFNQIILSGRCTARPELKTTTTGKTFTSFSIAVDRPKTRDGNKETDFFNLSAWEKTADFITRYFDKGSPIFIVGRVQNRSWTDEQGQKRFVTEIIVNQADFVESKGQAQDNPPSTPYYQGGQPARQTQTQNYGRSSSSGLIPGVGYDKPAQQTIAPSFPPLQEDDEELPF